MCDFLFGKVYNHQIVDLLNMFGRLWWKIRLMLPLLAHKIC